MATKLEQFLAPIHITNDKLFELAEAYVENFSELARSSHENFLATPLTSLPDGSEKGTFLAIDVGGSRVRVALVKLCGLEADPERRAELLYKRSDNIEGLLKGENVEQLFSWLGVCILESMLACDKLHVLPKEVPELHAGITFSFPMMQTAMASATVMPQGKGFLMTPTLDVVQLLHQGYEQAKKEIRIELPTLKFCAIANDTVSTFVAAAYRLNALDNTEVGMSMILGTGTNAAVWLPASKLPPEKTQLVPGAKRIVLNTEWGIRKTGLPLEQVGVKTDWDRKLANGTEKPEFMPFEYMVGGRYLGEITRILLQDFQLAQGLEVLTMYEEQYSLSTLFVSNLLQAASSRVTSPSDKTSQNHEIEVIGRAVAERSACLLAATCYGLLECSEIIPCDTSQRSLSSKVAIGAAGTTILKFPGLLQSCQEKINMIVCHKGTPGVLVTEVTIVPVMDGGIVGAAVIACLATS